MQGREKLFLVRLKENLQLCQYDLSSKQAITLPTSFEFAGNPGKDISQVQPEFVTGDPINNGIDVRLD